MEGCLLISMWGIWIYFRYWGCGFMFYTSKKELQFQNFVLNTGVRNICRHSGLTDDICSLPFRSQLLPLQVRVLHSILQHIVTLRISHSNEVTRLDMGLLDCLIRRWPVNLGYIIPRYMFTTPAVTNRLFVYGSVITKILRALKWAGLYVDQKVRKESHNGDRLSWEEHRVG